MQSETHFLVCNRGFCAMCCRVLKEYMLLNGKDCDVGTLQAFNLEADERGVIVADAVGTGNNRFSGAGLRVWL